MIRNEQKFSENYIFFSDYALQRVLFYVKILVLIGD